MKKLLQKLSSKFLRILSIKSTEKYVISILFVYSNILIENTVLGSMIFLKFQFLKIVLKLKKENIRAGFLKPFWDWLRLLITIIRKKFAFLVQIQDLQYLKNFLEISIQFGRQLPKMFPIYIPNSPSYGKNTVKKLSNYIQDTPQYFPSRNRICQCIIRIVSDSWKKDIRKANSFMQFRFNRGWKIIGNI